jgi:hypothetical protein
MGFSVLDQLLMRFLSFVTFLEVKLKYTGIVHRLFMDLKRMSVKSLSLSLMYRHYLG